MTENVKPSIVVAIDGSPEGQSALRWALRAAAASDADVEVVQCWHRPPSTGAAFGSRREPTGGSLRTVAPEVRTVFAEMNLDDQVVEAAVQGRAGAVLLESSTNAALLVLGARGRQSWQDLVFGNAVASYVRQAACPVAVVDINGEAVIHEQLRSLAQMAN